MLLSTFLPFVLLWFSTACPFMVLYAFIFCAEVSKESLVVVAWWLYIVLASAYHGSLLLLHLF
jgi:hypothetical protein